MEENADSELGKHLWALLRLCDEKGIRDPRIQAAHQAYHNSLKQRVEGMTAELKRDWRAWEWHELTLTATHSSSGPQRVGPRRVPDDMRAVKVRGTLIIPVAELQGPDGGDLEPRAELSVLNDLAGKRLREFMK